MYYNLNSYDAMNEYTYWVFTQMQKAKMLNQNTGQSDFGPKPFVVDIDELTEENENFRTVVWTGEHMQLALMSINVGEDIGAEQHHDVDQFICAESGEGIVMIGDSKDNLNIRSNISDGIAAVIPAGKWHNIINSGNVPLKLYTIYAPPEHPAGTVQKNRNEAK